MQTRSGEVSENMDARQMHRRSRRQHHRQRRQRRAKRARSLFCQSDFRKTLVEKISKEADALSRYLKRSFPEKLRRRLAHNSQGQKMPAALNEEIAAALNEILERPIYDEERFAEVKLSKPTQELLSGNSKKSLTDYRISSTTCLIFLHFQEYTMCILPSLVWITDG